MSAKITAETVRAIELVDAGSSLKKACLETGIAYNTLWTALRRRKGVKPAKSTVQKAVEDLKSLRDAGQVTFDAFSTAHRYAKQVPEYLSRHALNGDTVETDFANAFSKPPKPKRGRPPAALRHAPPAKESNVISDAKVFVAGVTSPDLN